MDFLKKLFGARKQQPTLEQQPAPERTSVEDSEAVASEPVRDLDVTFVGEKRQEVAPGIIRTYRTYKGSNTATAIAFLAQNPVTEMHHYIVVETREGKYGRDISGMFDETTGEDIRPEMLSGIRHGALAWYAPSGIVRGLWLEKTATAHTLDERGQRQQSYQAAFEPRDPFGKIIGAIFTKLPIGDYEIEAAGSPPRRITIRPGMVTEINKNW